MKSPRCIGNDPSCPCQDGDVCHYVDTKTTKAWPIPREEEGRQFLLNEHICPNCYEQKKLRTLVVLDHPRPILFCEICCRSFDRIFKMVLESGKENPKT